MKTKYSVTLVAIFVVILAVAIGFSALRIKKVNTSPTTNIPSTTLSTLGRGESNTDDCIMYGSLDSISSCYDKHCVKIKSGLDKKSLIGKTIVSTAESGMMWKFISDTKVLITRGHSVDDQEIPNQNGTWKIKNGEILIQDPLIKQSNDQYSFKNLQFFDCGNKIEGVLQNSFWMNDGSGYKEHLIENRIIAF